MAPPAKRRRRNVLDESDNEEEEAAALQTKPHENTLKRYLFSSPSTKSASNEASADGGRTLSPSPVRKTVSRVSTKQTAPVVAAKGRGTTKSKGTSPAKQRTRVIKVQTEEKGKSANLLTLFSRQSQCVAAGGAVHAVKETKALVPEDIITSDPVSDDEVLPQKAAGASVVGKNAQKRFKGSSSAGASAGFASARFVKPPVPPMPLKPLPGTSATVPVCDDDARPWSERFSPANLDELAVHKKKVADVRRWLEDVYAGRLKQRLMVLKGAAGTAKTTTLQLLAKDMHCEVLEWRNPGSALGATYGYQSAASQFEEFLSRGGQFGQLDVGEDPVPRQLAVLNTANGCGRRLILIEEFPNTFMRSSTVLASFRNTLLQFLAANTPPTLAGLGSQSPGHVIPIVMIISETLLTTTSASADSFTAHRLLGPEILRHPGTGTIEFNPIAPTILAKALELVVQKEARRSGRRLTPGPLVLQKLGELGDIRNAISSLEFLCVKGDNDSDWGAKVTFTRTRKGAKGVPLTRGEKESLELISQREASLGIFHAVGRVVYNKRDDSPYAQDSVEAQAETLPHHMAHLSRPKRSQVMVDTLIDETGTDTHTFLSALHENYALSCEQTGSQDPNSSLDYINGCIDYLSESDLLSPSWDVFFGGKGFSGGGYSAKDSGSHIVGQEDMAFHTAVRGLLFCLPSPVKRHTPPGGRGDSFKMYYPTSLKLWRAKEELESLADMWATKMLKGEDGGLSSGNRGGDVGLGSGSAAFAKPQSSAPVVSNRSGSKPGHVMAGMQGQAHQASNSQPVKTGGGTAEDNYNVPSILSLGSAARQELLLERLPYMAHIIRRSKCSFGSMRRRDLERLVSFQGIGPPKTDESDGSDDPDDNSGQSPSWTTDKPSEEPSPRKKRGLGALLSRTAVGGEALVDGALPLQSLVLSDDDIEDD